MEDRTQIALKAMAQEDPELAARLVLQTLPGAAAHIPGRLTYDIEVEGLGNWRVAVADGAAKVEPVDGQPSDGKVDFRLSMDPRTLAEMAAGAGPLGLMLSGRLRIHGKRRRALRLRALGNARPSLSEVVANGGKVEPDLLYRSLEYLIDPAWTRGHRFVVCYELTGEDGGRWYVHVNDGERVRVTTDAPEGGPGCTFSFSPETFNGLVAGTLTPTDAARFQRTQMTGTIHYGTLLGRWIDRSQGNDDAELEREQQQRELQQRRLGSWGGANGSVPAATSAGQGDPAHDAEGARRSGGGLLSYEQLYALWERQNWSAHEIDFSVDREQWLATPAASQVDTAWSLASFYIGEERVTADLAPFLLAAPSGEVELFLATQLVDEARHTAMFDRFGSEVMALSGDDLRSRLRELERTMLSPWREVFDGALRDIASQIKAKPDDLDLFVDGIVTYHMVIEGVLAMTGQHLIGQYMEEHDLYPGFRQGFSLVERDEHRHIAFGVRFLKDAVDQEPRYRERIENRIADLVPRAAHVFVPPYADSAKEFVSYGYNSRQIYGYAYRSLKRRMGVIGLECPPAEEIMPGPIEEPAALAAPAG
jgi:ribonucleoside-diphosphate reductase beta chain